MAKTTGKAGKAKARTAAGAKATKKPAARGTAAKKSGTAAKKPGATSKPAAAKKTGAAAKRPAKGAAKAAPRRAAEKKPPSIDPRKRHAFIIQHSQGDADFKNDGFRPYANYRDLGLAKATNGMAQAHIIRMVPPCTDEVRQRHYHVTALQYAYILKGWMKLEVDGQGEMVAKAGTFFIVPQNTRHTVLDYSDDCEMMEVILPANYETVNVPPAPTA